MKEGKDDSADRCCENNSMELLLLMRHYLLLSNESNLLWEQVYSMMNL